MHPSPLVAEIIPALAADFVPPSVHGTAALAHRAYEDHGLDDLLAFLDRPADCEASQAALMLDRAQAHALRFRRAEAWALQYRALETWRVFRVADVFAARSSRPLRLLALLAPGDLMINTPLDFITAHLDVRLDLLYVVPGEPLPEVLPDHDVAFFAVSESDPTSLGRLAALHAVWPRPTLNDPAAIARLSRDAVAAGLGAIPGICSPPVLRMSRTQLLACPDDRKAIEFLREPALIRPLGSHAGRGLVKVEGLGEIAAYLDGTEETEFFLTRFVDYRDASGLFRKSRVVVIDGAPFLCHMALSSHWMVNYLSARMEGSAAHRAEEAKAMAEFDTGFSARHATAFAALNAWMGLDYFQIDCAESPDGRLLVFEVDVAAIVHLMDPPDLFPYKPAQMRRVFAAFDRMLRRRAGVFA